jgi:hypothetical protein
MPGFGLLVRADEQAPFAYACDALLGILPTETTTPLAYRGDGALLVGTHAGLRILAAEGCPMVASSTELAGVPIAALAVHPGEPSVVYAATAEVEPAIHRSSDGAEHWQLRARLPEGEPISALLPSPTDPDAVYLSQPRGELSSILVSEDAGATFMAFEQERALVLLQVEASTTPRLWAMARDRVDRTVAVVRAEQPAGPWLEVLRVNFFGGFALDAHGVIWVGDEGGSVFRSSDGGDSWQDALPNEAVACLVHAHGALWACTPGSAHQRAIGRLRDGDVRADLEDVTAFADVDELVDCASELAVESSCASAWNEWRVDVQTSSAPSGTAGSPATPVGPGAPPADAEAGPANATDADAGPVIDPDVPTGPRRDAARGAAACHAASRVGSGSADGGHAPWLLLAWLVLAARRHVRCVRFELHSHGCRPHARPDRRSWRLRCRATSS